MAGVDTSQFPPSIMMAADDVVTASLASLEQGDVICIPGLEDPRLIAQVRDAQRDLLQHGRVGRLARRYAQKQVPSNG